MSRQVPFRNVSNSTNIYHKTPLNAAPFNCSAAKYRVTPGKHYPGPGMLTNHCSQCQKQRFRKSRHTLEVNDKRFLVKENIVPGPGKYNIDSNSKTKIHQKRQINKMVRYFKTQNLKSTSSKDLVIGNVIVSKPKRILNRQSVPFNSKAQRQAFNIRPQTAIGPGSYNLIRDKQAPQKLLSRPITSAPKVRLSASSSMYVSQLTRQDNSQWMGPGYYHSETLSCFNKSVNQNLVGQFGSTVQRLSLQASQQPIETIVRAQRNSLRTQTTSVFKSEVSRFQTAGSRAIWNPGSLKAGDDPTNIFSQGYTKHKSTFKSCVTNRMLRKSQKPLPYNNYQSSISMTKIIPPT